MWGSAPRRALCAALVAVATAGGTPASMADAISAEAVLGSARSAASAVWAGEHAYVFGGFGGGRLAEIVRFDPATGAVASTGAALPAGRSLTSAVWTGEHAYVFGGDTQQIVRYTPATDTVTVLDKLPTARSATSAVWDGQHAYIFGGFDAGPLPSVVRYTPALGATAVLPSKLPRALWGTSAVFDGEHAYVFGGTDGGTISRDIVRFTPATGAVALVGTMPSARYESSAVWNGRHAYVFGGRNQVDFSSEIVRFTPSTNEVVTMSAPLPRRRAQTAAVWDGRHAFVFGGAHPNGSRSDEVVRYDLAPGAPRNTTAGPGHDVGEVVIDWREPAANTYSAPIERYRVYRSRRGGPVETVAELGADARSFVDEGLDPLVTYQYEAAAVNTSGEGAHSLRGCTLPYPAVQTPNTVACLT